MAAAAAVAGFPLRIVGDQTPCRARVTAAGALVRHVAGSAVAAAAARRSPGNRLGIPPAADSRVHNN